MTINGQEIFAPPTLREGYRWDGMRIGLLGGSFNPPHEGHLHIAKLAKAKFDLDFVWWIVTPQNPLKDKRSMRAYDKRFRDVQNMLQYVPKQMPTHLEKDLGSTYTHETISSLKKRFKKTEFLWICGMDNALIFHKWDKWRDIIQSIPITFIARPPATDLVRSCPLRMTTNIIEHKFEAHGRKTNLKKPAIYWLSGSKMLDVSSTKIRNKHL